MFSNTKRLYGALTFLLWMVFIVAAFYVVQKPLLVSIAQGLLDTIWTIAVTALFGMNALGLGFIVLYKTGKNYSSAVDRILLGFGLGLGLSGLLGFVFGALGITTFPILIIFLVGMGIIFLWRGVWGLVYNDLKVIKSHWDNLANKPHPFTKIAFSLVFLFAFLLAMAPPIEAFDALSYHLAAPLKILEDGGIKPYDVYAFWHPGLVEANFLWGLGLGSDRFPQLIHLIWAVLGVQLVGYWAQSTWNMSIAQKSVLIILSMPSFYRLASWAYTDLALAFYTIAALYGVVKWLQQKERSGPFWLILSGVMAGFALGIKYTSFILPICIVIIILFYGRKKITASLKWILLFSFTAGVVAFPWYLRNWVFMDNPIYPFLFGGRFWDDFRMGFYSNPGSGIGWNLMDLFLLPLNATLGHQDSTYYGGRIGPVFIIFFPIAVYAIVKNRDSRLQQRRSIFSIGIFFVFSSLAWMLGVISTADLRQTRFLYPMLIPFSIITALGWQKSRMFDTPKLRLSFVVNFFVAMIVTLSIVDAGLAVIHRNPLAFTAGLETRESYLEKIQPAYAEAMQLLQQTPSDARIYFLFEPRSYYAERESQADLILDNLAHDLHQFNSLDEVLASWENEGYTHVLVNRRGFDFLLENEPQRFTSEHQAALDEIVQNELILVETTPDGAYELYVLHPE